MLDGELNGEVGNEHPHLKRGDVVIIPGDTRHRFVNRGEKSAVTFNVYSRPAYPAGTKG
jgi:mannose-6-phosphate isomerase-like protein (cupin superfamily)